MSDFALVYIFGGIVLIHLLIGFGWVFWKMRRKK